jgi:hypothetical protein
MRRVLAMMGAMTLLLSFVFMGSVGTALAVPNWNKDDVHFQHIFVIMMENHVRVFVIHTESHTRCASRGKSRFLVRQCGFRVRSFSDSRR